MTNPDRPNPSNRPTSGTGASPIGEDKRKRKPWWLLVLLAAIIIVALVLLLSRCGGDDNPVSDAAGSATSAAGSATSAAGSASSSATSSSSASTSAEASTPAATSPAATTPAPTTPAASTAGSGTLTANGTPLLPIATAGGAGGDLSQYVGQAAAAKGVIVLSAPADNGFWVGTSTTDQVYVHLLQPGLVSPHPVRAGDHISFTGNVVANSATLAADDGVDAAEGAAQLTAQKAHIEIAKSSVVFTS